MLASNLTNFFNYFFMISYMLQQWQLAEFDHKEAYKQEANNEPQ